MKRYKRLFICIKHRRTPENQHHKYMNLLLVTMSDVNEPWGVYMCYKHLWPCFHKHHIGFTFRVNLNSDSCRIFLTVSPYYIHAYSVLSERMPLLNVLTAALYQRRRQFYFCTQPGNEKIRMASLIFDDSIPPLYQHIKQLDGLASTA